MDLSMTYTNHLGASVRVAAGGDLHLMSTDLLDHEWSYEIDGQHVRKLRLEAREATLRIGMWGGSLAERTRLYRTLDADAMAAECGTLAFHGYSLRVLPVAASLDAWWFADGIEEREVTLLAPRPMWCRDVTRPFPITSGSGTDQADLDHPYDYPHDWRRGSTARRISVNTVGEAEFRLIVYGPATHPSVIVAGNRYEVDVSVPDGSRLELDTRDRTVRVIGRSGDVTNAFDARVRGRRGGGSYAFQPLPAGESQVTSDNTFGFDIVIHDERTEPAWDA